MSTSKHLAVCGVVVVFLIGSSRKSPPDPVSEHDRRWRAEVLGIAKDYERFGRVDHEARWAPELCRMPLDPKARMSRSDDAGNHGRKLYSVFAKIRDAYARDRSTKYRNAKEAPMGQWIVKESWTHEEFKGDSAEIKPVRRELKSIDDAGTPIVDVFVPFAKHGGKTYRVKEKFGLFIMLKDDARMPETDNGWIYATVAKDMKTITALGRIESCMKCHQDAPWDRQFGLPRNQE